LGWNKLGCKFTAGVPEGYSTNKIATTVGTLTTTGIVSN